MSNELLVGMIAAVGLAVIAMLVARFKVRAQRLAGSVDRADDQEVGR